MTKKSIILRLMLLISIISYVIVCIIPEWISSIDNMIYVYKDANYSKYSIYITIVLGILMILQFVTYRVLFVKKYRNPVLIGLSVIQIYIMWVHPALGYFGVVSIYVDMLKSLIDREYSYSVVWYVIAITLMILITVVNIFIIGISIQRDEDEIFLLQPKKLYKYIAVTVCMGCVVVYGIFLATRISKHVINAPNEEIAHIEKGEEWVKQIFGIESDDYTIKQIEGGFSEEAYGGHCKLILQVERDEANDFIKVVEEKYGSSAMKTSLYDAEILERRFEYKNGDRYYGGYCEPQRELNPNGEYMISKSTRRFIACLCQWDNSYEVLLYYTE